MTTKHTPGPWKLEKIGDTDFRPMDKDDFKILSPSMLCPGLIWGDDFPEQKANARLIAAAPELLEALRCGMYVMLAQSKHLTGNLKRQAEICAKSWDELIAKAEGRE